MSISGSCRNRLESVIESCSSNRVGVELNTAASWTLLRYVAGINERTAQKIDGVPQ